MPIINVNAFQNGINQKDFLTSYTDVYLKQSLANLSQRTAAKGDSIGFSSFNMKELFPNYTGDFNANNLIVETIEYPNENKVEGYLRLLSKDAKTISLSEDEANTKFIVNNIDNILNGIGNEYDENYITISDVSTINNVDYWHKESAVIANTGNSFIYKLVGHKKGGLYGEEGNKGYDNEYICEEIDNDGKFIEGFRVFIINENNLMYAENVDPELSFPENVYERLGLLHLYKQKDSKGNEVWKLSVYRVKKYEQTPVSLGDIIGQTSVFYDLIREQLDTDGSLGPSSIINGILNSQLGNMIEKLYTVDVDYNNTTNASWSVSTDFINSTWKSISDANSLCGTGNEGQLKEDSTKTGILGDIDIICGDSLQGTNGKLEYFAYDLSTLYPRVLEIFNEIMYKDSTNLKLKKRIISTLVHACRTNYLKQTAAETNNLYAVYFPITYEVKYNCNSNDLSQIYNLTSSIPVYFSNILSDKTTGTSVVIDTNSVEALKKIAYHFDTTDDPSNYVIAHSAIEKTVLYDLFLSYTDDIISSFIWTINFTMPYISDDGYWVINDIKTANYAKGKVEDQANLIMMASTNPDEFVASSHILTGAGMTNLKAQGSDMFEKKVFKSNYLQSNTNIASANLYNMQAWVPSDKYLLSIKDTDEFTYLQSSIVMAISSTSMEKDATTIQYAYYDTNYGVQDGVVTGTYDEVKIIYDGNKYVNNGYTDWKVKNDVVSYIYRTEENPNSINATIGNNGIITSFWTCQQKNDVYGATYWAFDYIRKPEDENEVALDFNYIGNLEQYVKYYTKLRFSPDDYEHSQLLFDSAVVLLKNNTSDSETARIWPVLINHLCDYYNSELGTDPSRSFGDESISEETQYYNQLNFGLEFVDKINKDEDGHVTGVDNSVNRRFKIDSYTTVENVPYTYYDIKEKDNTYSIELVSGIKEESHTYGIIPKVIPYTAFKNEYIPNAEYDVDGNKGNQYPFFDMKEALLKNVTTVNRNNIFAVEKKNFGTVSYGVLYNAYIGTAFDNNDKSVLHIGTSTTNPNMGTTTMTDKDSITYFTKMKGMAIDFNQIYLNGYTSVKGELIVDRPTWIKKESAEGYVTYTTLLYPNGIANMKQTIDNTPVYNDDLLSVETLTNKHIKATRYYDVNEDEHISYLNVTKLLRDNNVPTDSNTVIYGDKFRLSERKNTLNDVILEQCTKMANTQKEHPGFWQSKIAYFKEKKDECSYTNIYSPTSDEWTLYTLSDYVSLAYNVPAYDIVATKNETTGETEYTEVPRVGYILKKDADGQYIKNDDGTYQIETDIEGNELSYAILTNSYVCDFGKKLNSNEKAIYLELSTDLTDRENYIGKGYINNDMKNSAMSTYIVQANPIEISYTDITSYKGIVYDPAYTYIHTYLTASAYTEYWYCEGCELCNEGVCSMIRQCNKSSCKGYWTPSYQYANLNDEEDMDLVLNSSSNTYTYYHERYRYVNNKYEKYEVLSYYPIMKTLSENDFEDEFAFNDERRKVDNTTYKVTYLTYWLDEKTSTGQYVWMSMPNTNEDNPSYTSQDILDHWSTTIPVPRNIISSYIYDYIKDNETDDTKFFVNDTKYETGEDKQTKISIYNELITYVPGDDYATIKNRPYVQFPYNIVYTYNYQVPVEGNMKDAIEYKNDTYNMHSVFSYYLYTLVPIEYALTQRHVNIREILSAHSRPEFFNEDLSKPSIDYVPEPVVPNPEDADPYDEKNRPAKPVEYLYSYFIKVTPDNAELYNVDYKNNKYSANAVEFTITPYYEYRQKAYDEVYAVEGYWKYNEEQTLSNKATTIYTDNYDVKNITIEDSRYNINGDNIVINNNEITKDGKSFKIKLTPKNGVTTFDNDDAIKALNVNKSISSKVIFKYESVSTVAVIRGSYIGATTKEYILKLNDDENTKEITLNFTEIDNKCAFDITSAIQTITNGIITSEEYTKFTLTNPDMDEDKLTSNFVVITSENKDIVGKYEYTISIANDLKDTIKNYDYENNNNTYTLEEKWVITQTNNINNKVYINLKINIEKK